MKPIYQDSNTKYSVFVKSLKIIAKNHEEGITKSDLLNQLETTRPTLNTVQDQYSQWDDIVTRYKKGKQVVYEMDVEVAQKILLQATKVEQFPNTNGVIN